MRTVPASLGRIAGVRGHKAFSGKISVVHSEKHEGRGTQVQETSSKCPVPTELKTAQIVFGPMACKDPGEKQAITLA